MKSSFIDTFSQIFFLNLHMLKETAKSLFPPAVPNSWLWSLQMQEVLRPNSGHFNFTRDLWFQKWLCTQRSTYPLWSVFEQISVAYVLIFLHLTWMGKWFDDFQVHRSSRKYSFIVGYSPFQKNEPWQPQLVGWYQRRPLHDPNMVFAYWLKKKMTMFGAKTIVLSWYWELFPAAASEHRCVWPLKVLLSCYWTFPGFMAVIF